MVSIKSNEAGKRKKKKTNIKNPSHSFNVIFLKGLLNLISAPHFFFFHLFTSFDPWFTFMTVFGRIFTF